MKNLKLFLIIMLSLVTAVFVISCGICGFLIISLSSPLSASVTKFAKSEYDEYRFSIDHNGSAYLTFYEGKDKVKFSKHYSLSKNAFNKVVDYIKDHKKTGYEDCNRKDFAFAAEFHSAEQNTTKSCFNDSSPIFNISGISDEVRDDIKKYENK